MTADRTFADDLARRRTLAEEATEGLLEADGNGVFRVARDRTFPDRDCVAITYGENRRADAAFIAAHHPGIVKALWDVAEATPGLLEIARKFSVTELTDDEWLARDAATVTLDRLAAGMREQSP